MLEAARQWLSLPAAVDAELGSERALADPQSAQDAKLRSYLRHNAASAFGKAHHFSEVNGYDEFCDAVPVRSYADFEPWIERIAAGEKKVLTAEPVFGFEETSESAGAKKWIPFTKGLRDEFESVIWVWMRDLARHCPRAFDGRAYWSISPPVKVLSSAANGTVGGLPVGLDKSDLAYFSEASAALLEPMMAVSPQLGQTEKVSAFWRATVAGLQGCDDLALISVWSPSFFLSLDQQVRRVSRR